MFDSSIHACIQLIPLQASADVPSTSGSVPVDPMVPADIILPSWSIPLYQADGSVRETAITRHTDVLGYLVPEDTCPVSLLS